MPMMNYPIPKPELAVGSLLRGLTEQKTEPVQPLPENVPGGALRELIQEPLQRKLLPGTRQQWMEGSEAAFLAQLEAALKEGSFTPAQAASLINAIISTPSKKAAGKAGVGKATGKATTGYNAPSYPSKYNPWSWGFQLASRQGLGKKGYYSPPLVGQYMRAAPKTFGSKIVGPGLWGANLWRSLFSLFK